MPSPFSEIIERYHIPEELLTEALTHRSLEDNASHHNERLEFLGDAVLQIVVSNFLFRAYPNAREGYLTRQRALTVSEPTLTEAARRLGLGKMLRMSRGEEHTGGRDRPSILSGAFEAVTGAVFLTGGLRAATSFLKTTLAPVSTDIRVRDFKSILQEWAQQHKHETPTYRIAQEEGPDHKKSFTAHVIVSGQTAGEGQGASKKEAQQSAARAALVRFEVIKAEK